MDYDHHNREERYICAHLFRMLHEPTGDYLALRRFLGDIPSVVSFRIYTEVALIRDAYHIRRQSAFEFMDPLVQLSAEQEGADSFRLYSQLEPKELRMPHKTHPGQILKKGYASLTETEHKVYGAIQGMFNAKPDLAICLSDRLFVFEAKWTLGFDALQMKRTRNIAQVWSTLLYKDLGFDAVPVTTVLTLGLERFRPDISWESVAQIAREIYPENDRSRIAFENAIILATQTNE